MPMPSSFASAAIRLLIPVAVTLVSAGEMKADTHLASVVVRIAQATTGNAPDLQGIGLTAAHRRVIYDHVADESVQESAGGKPEIGATISDSVRLNEIPIPVKDQVGLLRDFKFAKLQGEQIVIVDPASRKIMDIVTKDESGR